MPSAMKTGSLTVFDHNLYQTNRSIPNGVFDTETDRLIPKPIVRYRPHSKVQAQTRTVMLRLIM